MTSLVNDICFCLFVCLNDGIFVNHDLLYEKLVKIGTDDRYNSVKKSTKFQSNADIFDGDMTSSNFDVMSDN